MIKKLSFLWSLCFIAVFSYAEDWDGSTSKPSSKEIDGVEYYVITSPSELAWFAYQVSNNGNTSINAILENNIYYMDDTTKLSTNNVASIGNRANPFDEIIDGNGKSIYGAKGTFFVDENTTNAVIKNLILKNAKYTSVVDTNKGLVENIELYGQTTYGFANLNLGTIKRCSNFAEISGSISGKRGIASGIAYMNGNFDSANGDYGSDTAKIIDCKNMGLFTSAGLTSSYDSIVGGISIQNWGLIENSGSVIDLRINKTFNLYGYGKIGGVVAQNYGIIRNSSGSVFLPKTVWGWSSVYNHRRYIGGIAAQNSQRNAKTIGKIENAQGNLFIGKWSGIDSRNVSWNSGDTEATMAGGIAGYNGGGLIQNCQSKFAVDTLVVSTETHAKSFLGGGVGHSAYISSKIFHSYSEMLIKNFSFASNKGYGNDTYVGGIVGQTFNTSIDYCHAQLRIGKKDVNSVATTHKFYWAGLTRSTVPICIEYCNGDVYNSSIKNSYVVLKTDTDMSDDMWLSGIVYTTSAKTKMSNVYFDKDVMAENYANTIQAVTTDSSESFNVLGKTTTVMQSPAFVETLNTNAGLDDDSGIWQYCEGNYPILVSEGTCEEFYSKYGMSSSSLSSSSSAESSSSTPVESSSSDVESSSSQAPASSSSSDVILSSSEESSSSSVIASSSSDESSSSKAETSSSAKSESSSSSKVNSSSSKGTDIVWNVVQPTFNLAVNGMTLTLSNTQGGVRIFDALGHLVAAKSISSATTSITLQTPGNYIVRVNGMTEVVNLK